MPITSLVHILVTWFLLEVHSQICTVPSKAEYIYIVPFYRSDYDVASTLNGLSHLNHTTEEMQQHPKQLANRLVVFVA